MRTNLRTNGALLLQTQLLQGIVQLCRRDLNPRPPSKISKLAPKTMQTNADKQKGKTWKNLKDIILTLTMFFIRFISPLNGSPLFYFFPEVEGVFNVEGVTGWKMWKDGPVDISPQAFLNDKESPLRRFTTGVGHINPEDIYIPSAIVRTSARFIKAL